MGAGRRNPSPSERGRIKEGVRTHIDGPSQPTPTPACGRTSPCWQGEEYRRRYMKARSGGRKPGEGAFGARRGAALLRMSGYLLRREERDGGDHALYSPDLPPALWSNFTPEMTMPRSTALHMS